MLALVSVGDVEDATLTVTASRPEPDGSVIAVAHTATRPAPLPRATLELPGYGNIDFVPTNRDALVHIAPAGAQGRLVLLPSEGAYKVSTGVGGTHIRGEEGVGGYVALRFGYRVEGLPAPFADADLAVLGESLQRPIRAGQRPGAHRLVGAGGEPAGRAGLHGRSRQRRSHQARQADVDRVFATRRLPRRHPPRALQARGRHPGPDAGHRRDEGGRHAALRRARHRTDGPAAGVGAAHRLDQRA